MSRIVRISGNSNARNQNVDAEKENTYLLLCLLCLFLRNRTRPGGRTQEPVGCCRHKTSANGAFFISVELAAISHIKSRLTNLSKVAFM